MHLSGHLRERPHKRERRKVGIPHRPLSIGQVFWESRVCTGRFRPSGISPHRRCPDFFASHFEICASSKLASGGRSPHFHIGLWQQMKTPTNEFHVRDTVMARIGLLSESDKESLDWREFWERGKSRVALSLAPFLVRPLRERPAFLASGQASLP